MRSGSGPIALSIQICEGTYLEDFNILVGCPRERERAARSEVQYFIGDLLGDTQLRVFDVRIVGLIACLTKLDPFAVIERLKVMATENPYQFRFAIRFTPLEFCVPSSIDEISRATGELLSRISENETFRVTVRKRHTQLETMQVVSAVAAMIPRKVDLDNPDKTVWIEIVGEKTGMSILDQEKDILSIMTLRDDIY
jgi:tRNA acetyltransferase TAN1